MMIVQKMTLQVDDAGLFLVDYSRWFCAEGILSGSFLSDPKNIELGCCRDRTQEGSHAEAKPRLLASFCVSSDVGQSGQCTHLSVYQLSGGSYTPRHLVLAAIC